MFLAATLGAVAGRGAEGAPDSLRVAAAACLIALLVHVALDWTWEFPAVALIPLILVAGLLAAPVGRPSGPRPGGGDARAPGWAGPKSPTPAGAAG